MIKNKKNKASDHEDKLKIGEHLVKVGAVKPEDIEEALNTQQCSGDKVGLILQVQGKVSAYRFYQEYAKFSGLEFVNLDEEKCDPNLLFVEKRKEYHKFQYLPFSQNEGVFEIATTNEMQDLKLHLDDEYGEGNYKIYITSPYDILWTLQNKFADHDIEEATNLLHNNNPDISSKDVVFTAQTKFFLGISLLLLAVLLTQKLFFLGFLAVLNVFYLSTMISKILFFFVGFSTKDSINRNNDSYSDIGDDKLPIYSILIPVYKEKKKTLKKLFSSLNNLDYPASKLDVKIICEIDDFETVENIKSLKAPSNFQIIRVPYSLPRTKPKACNYALNYCIGEYVTIYDAEDIPEPRQLRKAVAIFTRSKGDISCIQARLNYFNRNENILTGLFSIEYSSWFDYMLYGLKKLDLPIPLGGTSNHFKLSKLKALYAWDPYNVTEDADLGVRMAFENLNVEVIDNITMEEAPITMKSWLSQRARWIKGYVQTYFVHIKSPIDTYKKLGFSRFLGFTYFVGAPFFVFITVPIVMLIISLNFLFGDPIPLWLVTILKFNLFFGILIHLAISFYIITVNKWYDNILPAICFPFYWLLHYAASFMALRDLIKRPHHWNKTEHGVSTYSNSI